MVKIICAGFQKTGTKSLSRALEHLGYKVYDAGEVYMYMRNTWMDFFKGKITIEDVCREYDRQNVDVVVDGPANYFWEEMSAYWPNAKVILTLRDDEDKWYESIVKFYKGIVRWVGRLAYLGYLTPYGYLTEKHLTLPYHMLVFGNTNFHPLVQDFNNVNNEQIYKRKYREHNAYVRRYCPKDKLLVMNVKDGWAPLISFLETKTPEIEFPFRNKGGQVAEIMEDMMPAHTNRCKLEVGLVLVLIFLLPFTVSYYLNFILRSYQLE